MSYIVKVIPAPAGTSSTNVVYIPTLAGTLVDLNTTQTVTNKTFTGSNMTSAVLTTPTITNATVSGGTYTNCTINTPTTYMTVATLAAIGNAIGNANTVTSSSSAFILVTGADGTKGIKLPVAAAG